MSRLISYFWNTLHTFNYACIYDVKEGSQRKYVSRSIYVIDLSNLTQAFEYHSGTRNEMRMDKVI